VRFVVTSEHSSSSPPPSDDAAPASRSRRVRVGPPGAESPGAPIDAAAASAPEKVGAWVKEFALYPFFITLGIVGVFTLFSFLMREDETTLDFLRKIQTSGGNDRWYAAFQLSNLLGREADELRGNPEFVTEVVRIFEASAGEDPRVQRYLAIVLGRVGDSGTLPVLTSTLQADDDPETRIWAAWALGSIGDSSCVPALVQALEDADAGVRKMSAYALGSFTDPRGLEPLRRKLQDEVEDVRWNAAIALALHGDGSGFGVLRQLVNSIYLTRIEGMTDEQIEDVMLNAVKALGVLQASFPSARDLLEETSQSAPFPLVQRAARTQLEAFEPGAATRR
jgi:hypothetical protein